MLSDVIINRCWAMPNKNTFSIKPIKELILKYLLPDMVSIDPFANSNKMAKITNDLDSDFETDYNMDALDFLKMFEDESVDLIFYDPPYTPRQLSECYKKLKRSVTASDTSQKTWALFKNEINRILKQGGHVLSFGWNSNGASQNMSLKKVEILLVAHGGGKNDTICTVEFKPFVTQGNLFARQDAEPQADNCI